MNKETMEETVEALESIQNKLEEIVEGWPKYSLQEDLKTIQKIELNIQAEIDQLNWDMEEEDNDDS